jgi:hypothetical protein
MIDDGEGGWDFLQMEGEFVSVVGGGRKKVLPKGPSNSSLQPVSSIKGTALRD